MIIIDFVTLNLVILVACLLSLFLHSDSAKSDVHAEYINNNSRLGQLSKQLNSRTNCNTAIVQSSAGKAFDPFGMINITRLGLFDLTDG